MYILIRLIGWLIHLLGKNDAITPVPLMFFHVESQQHCWIFQSMFLTDTIFFFYFAFSTFYIDILFEGKLLQNIYFGPKF